MNEVVVELVNAGVTLLVGTFAYGVYAKGKRDAKRRAANVILIEVEEAEQHLAKVSVENPFPAGPDVQVKLMPVSSWNQYKHLFINDFDRNETDKISDFYARCEDYDNASSRQIEVTFEGNQQELRINIQRILADYAREYNDALEAAAPEDYDTLEKRYIERRRRFVQIYDNTASTHTYTYAPAKPYDDAKRALQGIEQSLSLTSVGTKLKSIARSRTIVGKIIDRVQGKA